MKFNIFLLIVFISSIMIMNTNCSHSRHSKHIRKYNHQLRKIKHNYKKFDKKIEKYYKKLKKTKNYSNSFDDFRFRRSKKINRVSNKITFQNKHNLQKRSINNRKTKTQPPKKLNSKIYRTRRIIYNNLNKNTKFKQINTEINSNTEFKKLEKNYQNKFQIKQTETELNVPGISVIKKQPENKKIQPEYLHIMESLKTVLISPKPSFIRN